MGDDIISPTLNLGRVAISLREFLLLRPSDVLVFNLPSDLEGVLEFGGEEWARVQVEFETEHLRLRVLEVGAKTSK